MVAKDSESCPNQNFMGVVQGISFGLTEKRLEVFGNGIDKDHKMLFGAFTMM
ncbi:18607_t:CDS:2, partial [Racocetra persica]